jgi:nucleolar GTP-binding protein
MLKIYMKNPFKRLHAITHIELIDLVFSDASKQADRIDFDVKRTRYGTTRMKTTEDIVRQKEGKRISAAANKFYNKLMSVVGSIPATRDIPKIYWIFADELVGMEKIENSVSRVKKVANYTKKIQGNYLDKLKHSYGTGHLRRTRKEFYGRLAGGAKKINRDLAFLVKSFDLLKELPSLRDCPTVVLTGLPNVGKTSLLKSITGSKPEIKAYPFTTKGLMIGYITHRFTDVQFIDTPGLLDRKKRNKIEIHSQIALKKIGDLVIYVFDISETCGYPLAEQIAFYDRIIQEAKKPVIAVINKTDVIGVPDVSEITNEVPAILVSCDSGAGIDKLKKEVIKRLFKSKK